MGTENDATETWKEEHLPYSAHDLDQSVGINSIYFRCRADVSRLITTLAFHFFPRLRLHFSFILRSSSQNIFN